MRNFTSLAFVAAVLTLFACSNGAHNPVSMIPGNDLRHSAERSRPSVGYAVIHSFGGSGDGARPEAGLIDIDGTFYGTTSEGGEYDRGTVFSLTPSSAESVLHSFGGSGDGAYPSAALINVRGTLYGTTVSGGTINYGTVFSITPSGRETVLHNFVGGSDDGDGPLAGLVRAGGRLYGTTYRGGVDSIFGWGTVFSITPSGTFTLLHRFRSGSAEDGANPFAGLIKARGKLFGTTSRGGANDKGTAFGITMVGTLFTVLHSFGREDGAHPHAGLIKVGKTLYGTTNEGGVHAGGTVFAITLRTLHTTTLYNFGGSGDGARPEADLIDIDGTFYGTTSEGGEYDGGTVFSLTPSGVESVLHSFGGSGDGARPNAGLMSVGGTLYGATARGGTNDKGTVFSLTPTRT